MNTDRLQDRLGKSKEQHHADDRSNQKGIDDYYASLPHGPDLKQANFLCPEPEIWPSPATGGLLHIVWLTQWDLAFPVSAIKLILYAAASERELGE
jgi:hypothetical protein